MLLNIKTLYVTTFISVIAPSCVYAVDESLEIKKYLDNSAYLIDSSIPNFSTDVIRNSSSEDFNSSLKKYDKYASYMDKENFTKIKKLNTSKIGGVGMDLVYDRQNNIRCIPFTDSPADNCGIEYQDILVAVDRIDVRDDSLEEIAELIRGEVNTSVELTIEKSDGHMESYEIERLNKVYKDVEKTGDVPETIKINRFSKGVALSLKKELLKLSTPDEKRIFIDLRGNTGGFLEEGAECAALFLEKGKTIYKYKSKSGTEEHKTLTDGIAKDRKVIIIMDSLTASSAELMISALKSNNPKVSTYGKVSSGKSIIQDVFNLKDGSVLKLSVGELLFKDQDYGWQDVGLKPDVEQQ